MPQAMPLEVEIDARQFEDVEQFEAARQEAYSLDVSERGARLQDIVESARLHNGMNIYDVAIEELTNPESADSVLDAALNRFNETSERVATTETNRKHEGITYRITIDPNGEVIGVNKLVPIKEDKQATKRNQHVSRVMPSGPKQNRGSFRTSVIDPSKRRG